MTVGDGKSLALREGKWGEQKQRESSSWNCWRKTHPWQSELKRLLLHEIFFFFLSTARNRIHLLNLRKLRSFTKQKQDKEIQCCLSVLHRNHGCLVILKVKKFIYRPLCQSSDPKYLLLIKNPPLERIKRSETSHPKRVGDVTYREHRFQAYLTNDRSDIFRITKARAV